MRHTTLILILGFIITNSAFADLPLEEIWSVEMVRATALGNAWTDDDGNHNVLVGDGWRAKLISNEEVIWTSDSLIGPVTALIRVPYADGEQILVAASEPIPGPDDEGHVEEVYGHLYRFGGDEYELLSDLQLLEYSYNIDHIRDERNVVKLAVTPEMLEAEDHPVFAAWKTSVWAFFGGDRVTGLFGVITDDSIEFRGIGVPVELEVFQDSNDSTLIALGWHRWHDEPGNYGGEYSCGFRLFDANLSVVNLTVLAEHIFIPGDGNNGPDRCPELLGMTVVQMDDQPSIFVAYSDSSNAFLSEMSVPDLDVIQTRSLPDDWRGGQMLSFQWELESSVATNLLLIDSRGSVLVFDAETLTPIEDGSLPEPYVASIQTDFEGDGNLELLALSRDRLTCYSITSLAVPNDQPDLNPTSLTLSEPYPNPFNAQLSIDYRVPAVGDVTLRMYDLTGRQIAELVHAWQTAGQYSVTYNATGLASGMYIIKLTAGSKTIVRKAVLMR